MLCLLSLCPIEANAAYGCDRRKYVARGTIPNIAKMLFLGKPLCRPAVKGKPDSGLYLRSLFS